MPSDYLTAFLFGAMYGVIITSIAMTWLRVTTTEWKHHDGTNTIDTFDYTAPSLGRIFYIVIASAFWPLSLLLLIAYGILRLPIYVYRKTGK